MICVYIDFKSPGAYLALAPTLELAQRAGVPIAWHPYRVVPRDVPRAGVTPALAETHHQVREASLRGTHRLYAELRGLSLRFRSRETSTDLALGVLAELRGDPLGFIEAAFSAYWEAQLDLDDAEIVSGLLESSGSRHNGEFARSREALERAQREAEATGIVDAPGYVLDGQVFVGRQHFPWIKELLGVERTT